MDYTRPSCLRACEEFSAAQLSFRLGIDFCFPAKSHVSMNDSVTKTTRGGENGESQSAGSPPAAGGVDSCCSSWMKSVGRRVPADYKNEALQCFKLAVPVVRSKCSDRITNSSQWCSGNGTPPGIKVNVIAVASVGY